MMHLKGRDGTVNPEQQSEAQTREPTERPRLALVENGRRKRDVNQIEQGKRIVGATGEHQDSGKAKGVEDKHPPDQRRLGKPGRPIRRL